MKHVFIAVGGSGTKVAEALVKLLAVGFPTLSDKGVLTSAGDSLEIWRIDPDRSSGALEDLNRSLINYRLLQSALSDGNEQRTTAGSQWSMEIETVVKDLNPLELPRANQRDNQIKTLAGILNSRYDNRHEDSFPLLRPFYEEKDLEVQIDEGFYQKPFIGSAVMAIFSQSLEQSASNESNKAFIRTFDNAETSFFLCGSLHGGTGASGVPVMAKFLKIRQRENPKWRIAGCLLAPYFRPPSPPFVRLPGDVITKENLEQKTEEYFNQYHEETAFRGLDNDRIRKLVRLILQDYYADPKEIVPRAKQGLDYYKREAHKYFDEIYLVGKPSPNQLLNWSNGGSLQRNPLNSTEVVAAIAALNFFARNRIAQENVPYVLASSSSEIDSEKMRLANLPSYQISTANEEIAADKVFLATALFTYLVAFQLPWEKRHEAANRFKLFGYYENNPDQATIDKPRYEQAIGLLRNFLTGIPQPHSTAEPTGWSADDVRELQDFFVKRTRKTIMFGERDVLPNFLGSLEVNDKAFKEFASWFPSNNFTRGEYFRHVWNQAFSYCKPRQNR